VEDDSLVLSLEQLRQALAGDASGRVREWAQTLGQALAHAEDGLRRHLATAESPEGPLAEVEKAQQSFARQTNDVCKGFSNLLQQSSTLRKELRSAAADPTAAPEVREIRRRVEQFLSSLQRAKEAETMLILDSVNTDVGVGD
jgi:hypothetical protein